MNHYTDSWASYAFGDEVAVDVVSAFGRHAVVAGCEGGIDAEAFADDGVEVGQFGGGFDGDVGCGYEGGADLGEECGHDFVVFAEVVCYASESGAGGFAAGYDEAAFVSFNF